MRSSFCRLPRGTEESNWSRKFSVRRKSSHSPKRPAPIKAINPKKVMAKETVPWLSDNIAISPRGWDKTEADPRKILSSRLRASSAVLSALSTNCRTELPLPEESPASAVTASAAAFFLSSSRRRRLTCWSLRVAMKASIWSPERFFGSCTSSLASDFFLPFSDFTAIGLADHPTCAQ